MVNTWTGGEGIGRPPLLDVVDVIPADEISGACVDRRDRRFLAALTRDNDEGHLYPAGAEHSESGECVKGQVAMRAGTMSQAPSASAAVIPPRIRHPPPTHTQADAILECAHGELGSGIRALDDQNRELTVDDHPRTKGHAQITATRGAAPTPPPRSLP